MTNDEVCEKLGLEPQQGVLIEATLGFGEGVSAAEALGMNYRTYRNQLGYIRRLMSVSSTMHLCVAYDRIQRGLPASEAMKGFAR